jgi:acyl-CoA hydrolase
MTPPPQPFQDVESCVDAIIKKVGKEIVFGIPLGLGKPSQLTNALYQRAKSDPSIHLHIITALTLELPSWSSELERRFLEPFVQRVFGDCPALQYASDLRRDEVPPNVQITEFFMKPGGFIDVPAAQQNYISCNYTHAFRDILDSGVNVIAQLISKIQNNGAPQYSMSCNPEVALDLVPRMRAQEKLGKPMAIVGQVNPQLPFMYGDAVVKGSEFDMIVDDPAYYTTLFGTPKMAISNADFMIGLYASTLMKDGGTLQIGIGSLGDALCYGLQLRHENNAIYADLLKKASILKKFGPSIKKVGGTAPFDEGLYGSTEMLVDGYLHLMQKGIVKRRTYNDIRIQRLLNAGKIGDVVCADTVDALLAEKAIKPILTRKNFDFLQHFGIFKPEVQFSKKTLSIKGHQFTADLEDPESRKQIFRHCLGDRLNHGVLIHAGFFLGPQRFYDALNEMSEAERKSIYMTSVLNVNQLYGNKYAEEELKILQRKHARFVNAALMVTLSGAVVSDGLENGQVVSGVGGQYNFVSMAHALPDGRSILMAKSTRNKGKSVSSNVVWNYGHITIPRHLRDFVITEYGMADLRSKNDKQIIKALLNITDSRFQDELLSKAKAAKKIPKDYTIPDHFKNNTPQRITDDLAAFRKQGFFPAFPFGTDFTDEELAIGKSLRQLKEKLASQKVPLPLPSLGQAKKMISVPEAAMPYLSRLSLDKPQSGKERMMQRLVVYALSASGQI